MRVSKGWEHLSYEERLKELRQESSGDLTNVYKNLTGNGGGRKMEPSSFQGCTVTGQEVSCPSWEKTKKLHLNERKSFFCVGSWTQEQVVQGDCKGIQKPSWDGTLLQLTLLWAEMLLLLKYLTRSKDSIILSSNNLILGYKFMFSIILHIYVLLYCSRLHTGRLLLSKNYSQCLCMHNTLFTVSYLLFSYTYYILSYRPIFRHI